MKLPHRFDNLRPYIASFLHSRFQRPPVGEIIHWITQPGKEQRANRFIESKKEAGDLWEIQFRGFNIPFYYPKTASWIDLCQTVDECLNPKNWHHFITDVTPIHPDDVVVDCGAAEGLFSFVAGQKAKKVYAVEPIPFWHNAMEKTFASMGNVEVLKVVVGHKISTMRMIQNEIYSRVSTSGDVEIQIVTLDSLFADQDIDVTFLKADVEGFEFQTLLGAEGLIRKNRPKIAMTMYHDTNHFIEIQEFLKDIHQDYRFATRGIASNGHPILILAY